MNPLAYCFVGLCVLQLTVIGALVKLFLDYVNRSEIRLARVDERARVERHDLEIKLIAMLDPTAAQVAMSSVAYAPPGISETEVTYMDEERELRMQRDGDGAHA